ncbi:hypothetical protein BCR44DRAFT_1445414 [Catenaria anguillulae PL171]|uniref:Uncharacterized protein n=1 Tax=Catenaria anguillulae PL171 TaxID=765915 RepID=A0A1Y2H6N4_9FUNG|nr:hypothetical protein BCR44DRAFT_1445414 [Catenaria anguillulae PL171]
MYMNYFVVRFVLPFPFPFWPCVSFLFYLVSTQPLMSHSVPVHLHFFHFHSCVCRSIVSCWSVSLYHLQWSLLFFGLSQSPFTFSHRLFLSDFVIFGQVLSLHVLFLLDL